MNAPIILIALMLQIGASTAFVGLPLVLACFLYWDQPKILLLWMLGLLYVDMLIRPEDNRILVITYVMVGVCIMVRKFLGHQRAAIDGGLAALIYSALTSLPLLFGGDLLIFILRGLVGFTIGSFLFVCMSALQVRRPTRMFDE